MNENAAQPEKEFEPDSSRVLEFLRTEAAALSALADRYARTPEPLAHALAMMQASLSERHPLITTGIGKSGLIAQKIAATLRSTGSPAHFLHPAEAVHGDLGMLSGGSVVLLLSYSGETAELVQLLPAFQRRKCGLVVLTGCLDSTLARAASAQIDCSVSAEACALDLAPTASTTAMLAVGDALALELSRRNHFTARDFAELHPGGRLGVRLACVRDLMHAYDAMPRVAAETTMPQLIHEMSSKKLGMTTVLSPEGKLLGIISDGDLRRLLERAAATPDDTSAIFQRTAGELMNASPRTIAPETMASEALVLMEEKKITSLIVVEQGRAVGVIHLHDLYR